MDNYSKTLFFIRLDHYYWAHVTLLALSNTYSHSGKLKNHYWLITIDYMSSCIHILWIFIAVKTLKYVLFSSYKKGNTFQKLI